MRAWERGYLPLLSAPYSGQSVYECRAPPTLEILPWRRARERGKFYPGPCQSRLLRRRYPAH